MMSVRAPYWASVGVSALLVIASACGDDEGEEDAPPDPPSEMDAGASVPDASTPEPVDSGTPVRPADASTVRPDAGVSSDAGSSPDASGGSLSAAAMRGMALARENACASCHTASYAGGGFYPNITPHPTSGIGEWSDDEIAAAIREGQGPEGELCSLMMRYELSDDELDDLVAFLKSLAPVDKTISAVCPGS